MDLHDLTLLIPVRDRHYNLDRVFQHYKDLDCQKIIVDSSVKRYDEEHKAINFGFKYNYYGPICYPELKYKMVSDTQTEFVVDCADDDLILLSSLKMGVDFLRKNKNYVTCYGEEYWFDPNQKKTATLNKDSTASDQVAYDFEFFTKTSNRFIHHLKSQFCSENPVERIKFNSVPMMGSAHCLHRTKILSKINKLIFDNVKLHPINWAEQVTDILTSAAGNRKILNCIWNVRYVGERLINILPTEELWGPRGEKKEQILKNLDHGHLNPICKMLSNYPSDLNLKQSYEVIKDIFIKCNDQPTKWGGHKGHSHHLPHTNHDDIFINEINKIGKLMKATKNPKKSTKTPNKSTKTPLTRKVE